MTSAELVLVVLVILKESVEYVDEVGVDETDAEDRARDDSELLVAVLEVDVVDEVDFCLSNS